LVVSPIVSSLHLWQGDTISQASRGVRLKNENPPMDNVKDFQTNEYVRTIFTIMWIILCYAPRDEQFSNLDTINDQSFKNNASGSCEILGKLNRDITAIFSNRFVDKTTPKNEMKSNAKNPLPFDGRESRPHKETID
jgi:hypothetical protein